MRVLLTGGAGFIARHVRVRLTDAGHDVVVLDSLRDDVHRGCVPDVPLVRGDVRSASDVQAALRGVDVVCHLAAKVGLGVSVSDLPDYASSNDHGTAVLLAEMAEAGVRRLVLASSMVVYGEGRATCDEHGAMVPPPRAEEDLRAGRFEPRCPLCRRELRVALVGEDTPVDPRNAYAASKVAQEHFASAWARATGGSVAALRFHNVYGPGLPADTPYAGVAALFLSTLRRGSPPAVFEDGGQRRDFVHVRDVAAAAALAAERFDGGFRPFNVGSGTPRTVGELATELASAAGGPAPELTGRYRLGDVRHITADSSRIGIELGWAPVEDFSAGIAELCEG